LPTRTRRRTRLPISRKRRCVFGKYDEPIVPRAQYEEALHKSRDRIHALESHIERLSRRLTAVSALPDGLPDGPDLVEETEIPYD